MNHRWLLILGLLIAGCEEPLRRRSNDDWDRFPATSGTGNIRVTTTTYEAERADAVAFDAVAAYQDSSWTIQAGGLWSANGVTVFVAKNNWAAAFRADARSRRTFREWRQMLMTMDGQPAGLRMVESTPVPMTQLVVWSSGAAIVRTYAYVMTGATLEVTPRQVDRETVDVELVPIISYANGSIRIEELRTRLRVPLGRDVVIVSHDERQDSFARGFFWSRAGQSERRVVKVVRVDMD